MTEGMSWNWTPNHEFICCWCYSTWGITAFSYCAILVKGPLENDHRSGAWHRSSCSCGRWDCESCSPGLAQQISWISSEPGQFSAKQSSEHGMSSGCCAEDRVARVGGRGCSLSSCGQCWEAAAALLGDLFHSLCVHQSLKNPWIQD